MEIGGGAPPLPRQRLIEFLLYSVHQLGVTPIVKYTALMLFADRFLCLLPRREPCLSEVGKRCWLLNSLEESNMQLFSLVSIWISSKLHDTCPLSVKVLKSLGDNLIKDQHFTRSDIIEAELVFLEVIGFEIGASNLTFSFLEELLIQFRELSRVGELMSFPVCLDVMDLLYESEAASYVLTVPKQRYEFPLIPWVKVVTSYGEEEIGRGVETILRHIFHAGK